MDASPFVPAIIPIFTSDGGLRGLPLHSEMEFYIYNKEPCSRRPASIRTARPTTWEGLYAAAPKLTDGTLTPYQVRPGPGQLRQRGVPTWCTLNSIPGAKLLSDDRTQVLFGDDLGLAAFKAIEDGVTSRSSTRTWRRTSRTTPSVATFNEKTASMINFAELWGYATGGESTKLPRRPILPENVGATIVPGLATGNSGSINGFEGFGINKFSTEEGARHSTSWTSSAARRSSRRCTRSTCRRAGPDVLTNARRTCQPSRSARVLARQGTFNLNRYPAPYDWTPPISDSRSRG